ncbi:MAG: hypothetical protein DMG65_02505 [Candidatus Angelobacter sp. Gp1-AA117]|nr:MAG: hypothetical protein DMG65_02505 [Candidatus Angelobacter sp. Gp1-AA117]
MLRWIIAVLLIAFSALAIIANGHLALQRLRAKNSGSFAMIMGGVLGAIGILLLPVSGAHKWFWLPAVLDFGCLPYFVMLAWFSLSQRKT